MCVVLDSNVWFSLYCGDLHLKVLQLGDRVCSVDYVVRKELVSGPNGEVLKEDGLRVEEVSGEGVEKAYAWRAAWPQLSMGDVFSLALAWERGWRLATRDDLLERLAKSEDVAVLCVVGVMRMMAEAGILTEDDIRNFKRGMYVDKGRYDKRKLRDVDRLVRDKSQ